MTAPSGGGAPGTHVPVLLHEALEALIGRRDGIYVDATFGRGGHSRGILERLEPAGRLFAMDRDPEAVTAAAAIEDPRFTCVHANFGRFEAVLDAAAIDRVDGVLLDLGVSSPQLDDPVRGFSFRRDGPLDMRMDPTRGESAADWLARAEERDIGEVIRRHGEERFAQQIAGALVAARARGPVRGTRELAALVAAAVRTREPGQDPATRTFQALRIHVNQELEELEVVLPAAAARLCPGGRLAVISFHSLEDRIVKRFMREMSSPPPLPPRLPVRAADIAPPRMRLVGRSVTASAAEIAANPRARSARLRVAEAR
ncbi:MAG: 16S rRNA (cytosine(1402)-N(4))-methyltransferase RsmH [Burkholderiales bacterium]|nr:16S rRNA (cytosine(1402)-N(4))-methyltransferase RsmH [Burkholderiales bacterium]